MKRRKLVLLAAALLLLGRPETGDLRAFAAESPVEATMVALENSGAEGSAAAEKEEVSKAKEQYSYMGTFRLTAYCGCRVCNGRWTGHPTALGTDYQEGRTIAVDRRVIPLGSTVEINLPGRGWTRFRAEDTGSAIKGNRIDVYVSEHGRCYTPLYNTHAEVRIVR